MRTESGLALYLLLARPVRGDRPHPAAAGPPGGDQRPPGAMIWLHAGDAGAIAGTLNLVRAMRLAGVRASYIITTATDTTATDKAPGSALPKGAFLAPAPADTLTDVREFLDRWRPDAVACIGGGLRPGLVHQAHLRGIPVFLFDAPAPRLAPIAPGWLPGVMRGTLRRFTRILARGPQAARALRRAGAPADIVEIAGPLQEGPGPLPHTEAEREALSQLLGPRPVWLAVDVPEAEEDRVIAAHIAAQRHSHRLLLILVPKDPARGAEIAARLNDLGALNCARRSAEEYPEEEVSVYIADTDGELGLWFRLAPITYLGGTMTGDDTLAPGPHPFAAAALGSVVLHGPAVAECYKMALADLAEGQASRLVRGSTDLAEAIGDLLAPDRAAAMALNAWQVTSDRDAITERAARLLREALPVDATTGKDTAKGPA
jgi:3-deoxy-D-manno-octulosonic-acid transferase